MPRSMQARSLAVGRTHHIYVVTNYCILGENKVLNHFVVNVDRYSSMCRL
ncbi:hypothetical protein XBKB1_1570002 [Xenorhabdus bovienii str. kraussei Becker Underwood]|uniref:Uncharacterized protein n=1 Tax=Xenorhabdus bovienii str. kraussei Becker Underwood TaxID=1398204 RepID=A0A077PRP3_XENBV|nr:hypothetical protein XBKB1_1570002 [Xenorhabdus bovienii str. kraussei Becker Underwood]